MRDPFSGYKMEGNGPYPHPHPRMYNLTDVCTTQLQVQITHTHCTTDTIQHTQTLLKVSHFGFAVELIPHLCYLYWLLSPLKI